MQRVMILGCCGSGKSTLARTLGTRTSLPVIHLDAAYWKAGWTPSSEEEFKAKHDAAVEGERWIIDGNYSRLWERRVAAADTIILLDLPRRVCIYSILRRWLNSRGRTRPDMTEGCAEKMDWEFFMWTWNFNRRSGAKQAALIESMRATKQVHVFHSRRDAQQWLNQIGATER